MALVVLKTRGNDFKRLIMLSTVQKPAELVYAGSSRTVATRFSWRASSCPR
jgi:hypothetical protein